MDVSRRDFMKLLGLGSAAAALPGFALSARGREAMIGSGEALTQVGASALRLDSNENPNGPGPAALDALRAATAEANRYPGREYDRLQRAIAARLGVPPESVFLTCGSEEFLRVCVEAFTSDTRPLLSAAPTFELPAMHATRLGRPVVSVPVDSALRLDLEAMAAKATGAGLVFVCNPNNPTATVHGAKAIEAFVDRVSKASPETILLIDEAYHDYVEDPAYGTAIPLAMSRPNVVVSRTFSKAHGMAGLRCGYGIGRTETLARLQGRKLAGGISLITAAAAAASIADPTHIAKEQKANRAAREYTADLFRSWGFAFAPSEANFLMVDVRRDARAFQQACLAQGVRVGRPFPPLATQARISIGTMEEMRRAGLVFKQVLKG